MRGLTKLSIAAAIIGIGSLLISYIGGPSRAAVDNTRDCDTVAIYYCGSMNEAEFHQKWNNDTRYKDHAAVYAAFGINKADVTGTVDGVVWKDGRVTLADGTLVATNATTAGRWNNPTSDMTKIPNTSRAYKMSTRHFVTEGQTAMIKMVDGQFKFAIIKSCGNPVVAKPQAQPKAICTSLATPVITDRTRVSLASTAAVENGATISEHIFTIHDSSGKQVNQHRISTKATTATTEFIVTTPGTYTAKVAIRTSLGDMRSANCEKKFTIDKPTTPTPETPVAKCDALDQPIITNRTQVALNASASTEHKATISAYVFTVINSNGQVVASKEVKTTAKQASTQVNVETAGDYTAKVVVKTSLGDKNGPECEKKFTIQPEQPVKKPGINIEKKVDGVEHKKVDVNIEFTYQIRVTNTGDLDLKDAVVTDKQPKGVTLLSANQGEIKNGVWTYTIATLKKGESRDFTIKAKVPEHLAGTIVNTVCVDTPTIPGSPDDCDDATVEVPPKPEEQVVCKLEGKVYPHTIPAGPFDKSLYSSNPADCKETPVTPTPETPVTPETPTPPRLPETGATDGLLNALGLGALTTSAIAYAISRRNSLLS